MNKLGYAVIVEYWNGSTYRVDYDNIIIYADKDEAEAVAKAEQEAYGAEAMVTVCEVEIKT